VRRLLAKELKTLLREPMVVVMIVMPFVTYSFMAPFYSAATEQAEEAAKLRGVRIALAGCQETGPVPVLGVLAASLRAANVTVDVLEACRPVEALKTGGYDAVIVVNSTGGRFSFEVYVRGDLTRLTRTLALPGSLGAQLGRALSPGAGNVTSRAYVLLGDRLWSFEELSSVYGAGAALGYATFFILFPAASLGAALMGAEREERMLDVLFSLPVRRRSIALSKAAAALVASLLTAASALAGLYRLFGSIGVDVGIPRYYSPADLTVYVAALASEALFAVILAMLVGLFASTMRGAQSAATIVVLPAIIPPMMTMTGIPVSRLFTLVPYTAALYAGLAPLAGLERAATATAAQLAETALALLLLVKLLESEAAVTGPETLRRLRSSLAHRLRGRHR